eukprot:scaffold47875_cov34-Tisochrysis_lutea.AAC.2
MYIGRRGLAEYRTRLVNDPTSVPPLYTKALRKAKHDQHNLAGGHNERVGLKENGRFAASAGGALVIVHERGKIVRGQAELFSTCLERKQGRYVEGQRETAAEDPGRGLLLCSDGAALT